MDSRLVWGLRNAVFDLRDAVSDLRFGFDRWSHRAAEYSGDCFHLKIVEPIRRWLFSIHAKIRNKK